MADFPTLGFHPAPGDLVGVESLIDGLRAVVADLAEVDTVVRADSFGEGTVVEALNESLRAELGPRLEELMQELDGAARALQLWHDSLADYQLRASALEDEAATAQLDAEDASAVETVRERARILQEEVDGEAGEVARMLVVSPISLPADPAALIAQDDNLAGELETFLTDVAPQLEGLPHDVATLASVGEVFSPPELPDAADLGAGPGAGADWSAGDAAGAWAEAMADERDNPFDLPFDLVVPTADDAPAAAAGAGSAASPVAGPSAGPAAEPAGSPAVTAFDPHVPGLGDLGWSSTQV